MPEKSLHDQITEYISNRGQAKLEKFDKETEKEIRILGEADLTKKGELERARALLRKAELQKYKPENWLTNAAARAHQINIITHALKFSHGDAKGSSVMDFTVQTKNSFSERKLICTALIPKPTFDVDGNAAALDIAGLLNLKFNGVALIQYIVDEDHSAFEVFSKDPTVISDWANGFKATLTQTNLSSHKLAKQLYFPTNADEYHLLSPLFASSLADVIHHKIINTRYTDEAKEVRKLKRERKQSDKICTDFVNIATQHFGGTKPQNISLLNSARRGQAFLLSAQPPPQWTTQVKPPVNAKNAFWRELMRQRGVYRTINEFRTYLEKKEKKPSTKTIRNRRANYVDELVGHVLQYSALIQSMPAGWSDHSQLAVEERLWLDLNNQAVEFQEERDKKEWQEKVARRFGAWLNGHLNKSKSLAFADVEFFEWRDAIISDLELTR